MTRSRRGRRRRWKEEYETTREMIRRREGGSGRNGGEGRREREEGPGTQHAPNALPHSTFTRTTPSTSVTHPPR
eukprot:COSAG02_NODE_18058_length_963_cov_2192.956019_2_plen_74_part_00